MSLSYKKVSGDVVFKGVVRKSVIFIVKVLLDRLLNASARISRALVCYFYLDN
ncbi:phage holin family protein [Clostridium sp. UBA5119]|uniref:phage holin family protein n=1 Tax=Clostridium sp. UBA5119 TaxID=1946366 RepID=UPI0032170E38